jgi:hypothetical protein
MLQIALSNWVIGIILLLGLALLITAFLVLLRAKKREEREEG